MDEPLMVVYGCKHTATPVLDVRGGQFTFEYRELPCLGGLDPLFLLRSLDEGADAVLAVGCFVGRCHHLTGSKKATSVVKHVGDVLEEVGLDRKRVGIVLGSPLDEDGIIEGIGMFMENLRGDDG